MKFIKTLSIALFLMFWVNFSNAQFKTIKTQNGLISGFKIGTVNIFKGIPFAAPPVGDLRWKAPQPVQNWLEVRKCTEFSASPFQANPTPFYCWTEEFIAPPKPLSEDCLYLNVWTAAKTAQEKRPVFVWIYGGGFSSGSSACPIYDGEEFAKKGIVFVSINYRVGPFGFMAHPELSKEQNNVSGNYGLMDQIAALKWVKENIAVFGGDPNKVTIAGQSAGSMSVNCLVASPLAKGLFHRAIAQSGGMLSNRIPTSLNDAEKMGETFQKKANASDLSELRQKSAEEILKISQSSGLRMGVTLDGYVLPTDIVQHFKDGKHNDVPLMTGWVTGDAGLIPNQGLSAEKFRQQSTDKYGAKSEEYLKLFPANTDDEAKTSQSRLSLLSFAALSSHLWAGYNKSQSYIYQVSHVPTDKPDFPNYGAFHTSEVPYALHTLHLWKRPWQDHDLVVENLMSSYWINFIKIGNPNGKNLPEWKRYTKETGVILEIDKETYQRPALLKKEFDLLESL
ncbi:carboxylesterase family protein [Arcicella sp. LKC2W]|uniref:carboxylesterase/lipase family protein n=1 Tax=Arcicella sp. LKC2W TaxID=2984198 RepID=UPI002B1F5351|nr:carboxylesterase family protein [Arcicella sp. LKC2W]MEA5460685.1 carboxylesterase family protein [Arcicella sp. LKC2W]